MSFKELFELHKPLVTYLDRIVTYLEDPLNHLLDQLGTVRKCIILKETSSLVEQSDVNRLYDILKQSICKTYHSVDNIH
ncbi:unnamed protein product [Heterobilharzia americana]|nr:unnamed protein product [Heterobilharzia americana]